jgi:endoglucanase
MDTTRLFRSCLLLVLGLALAAAEVAPRLAADCSQPMLFTYGSWDKRVQAVGNAAIIRGVNGQGGGGWNTSLDLSADPSLVPALRLRVGDGNGAESLALLLRDAAGRTARWNFRLAAGSEGQQTLRPRSGGSLLSPDARENGEIDLAQVMQWQLLGDWSGKPVDVAVEGLALLAGGPAQATGTRPFDLVEASALTERIVVVYVKEGHVVHHKLGQKRRDSHVELTQLDVNTAVASAAWSVRSAGDADFTAGVKPERVARKSKGVDFAMMVQGWDGALNRTVNTDPDHAKAHWLYLMLPKPMKPGQTYTIDGSRIAHVGTLKLTWDPLKSRSEAVHVNLLGWAPDTAKFAYVYHWAGDLGSLDLAWLKGRKFQLVEQTSGKVVFTGTPAFRAPADQLETRQPNDTPKGSFLAAEVWECDFSAFTTPGTYVVAVDGVGCSFPFSIGPDVYREAFRTTARGLYHNRSGIALEKPYTEFTRPAPANPLKTPGFAGKMRYTTSPWTAWKDADGGDKPAILAGDKGPLDVWGFYQDAGDWDGYYSHLNVATTLLFAYEMAPRNFSDGELNIPESGNGVPDIIDEAAWLPRFGNRLRHALLAKGWGSGGIGLRVAGDFTGGDERADGTTRGSWQDDRVYFVSGEDHCSTMRYAGACAHLAYALGLAKVTDPEGVDWLREAKESWTWAQAHAVDQREEFVNSRMYAAAALFRLTGDAAYEQQLYSDSAAMKVGDELWWEKPYGAWIHCLGGGAKSTLPEQAGRLRQIVLRSCEIRALETTAKRALRWGGGFDMPMLAGQQTTPWIMEGMVGNTLLQQSDPAKAKAFRDAVATTCDYMLGTNALNQTWVTGLGVRHVNQVFHMDGWYNGKPSVHPGVIPYGPWRDSDAPGQGPWDVKWPNATVYPAIAQWPGNERWFDNRNCPMSSEFTIHQTTCWAAATYGWMCGPR